MRLSSVMSRRILKIWLSQADMEKERYADQQICLFRASQIFMSFSRDTLSSQTQESVLLFYNNYESEKVLSPIKHTGL